MQFRMRYETAPHMQSISWPVCSLGTILFLVLQFRFWSLTKSIPQKWDLMDTFIGESRCKPNCVHGITFLSRVTKASSRLTTFPPLIPSPYSRSVWPCVYAPVRKRVLKNQFPLNSSYLLSNISALNLRLPIFTGVVWNFVASKVISGSRIGLVSAS